MKGDIFKKIGYIIITALCILFCVRKLEGKSNGNMIAEKIETKKEMNVESVYPLLDRDVFGDEIISWYTDTMEQEVFIYAESVKGDLVPVWEEDSIFPQGLVKSLEEMIYQSLDHSLDKFEWEEIQKSVYFRTMNNFGADDLNPNLEEMKILFPELKDSGIELKYDSDAYRKISGIEECYNMFHFHITPEQDNYLLAIDSGGSAGHAVIQVAELKNGEFRIMSEFETQNSGYGRVIQYEEQFYYVFLPYNYNLKNYDGVALYKLGNESVQENILIKYLPYSYMWKNICNTAEGIGLEHYIESIKEEMTSDTYLENGMAGDIAVYYGDEEAVDVLLPEDGKTNRRDTCYQIDFLNIGIPIYIRKSNFIPSNYNSTWHLKSCFYLQNPEDSSISMLENMEVNHYLPNPLQPSLVQMWFKEMEGKVYTFCLYHVSDYNYMLNVVRLEGNEANRIRTDILSPRRHFVLTEGEKTIY